MNIDVIALGEILIDFAAVKTDGDGYPTMAAHAGGAPANFLAALAGFGDTTSMIGKVGSDAFGKMLIGTLENCGIGTENIISDDKYFTTLAFVTFDEHGDREFSFARKPGADTCITAEEIDYEAIENTRVFHFGTLSLTDEPARSATMKAVLHAKSCGKLISFDPNLRKPLWSDPESAKEAMLWGLSQSDIVKISDDEVEFLFGTDPYEGMQYLFREFPVKLVYVTCGAEGCYYKNRNAEGYVKALDSITVLDTTGAGDIFGGSAMHMMLKSGKSPEDLDNDDLQKIVRFASASAGLSTTRPGAIPSIPSENEVLELLSENA